MCPEMCQAMQEIIEDAKNDVRNEYIEENNKLRAEANEAKAQIIFLKERIAQLEKAVKDQGK